MLAARYRGQQKVGDDNTEPTIAELNAKHSVFTQEGSKTRVLTWERSELDDNRDVPVLQSFADFRNRYMNRRMQIGEQDGKPILKSLGQAWLEHSGRREYLALRFVARLRG